MKKSLPKRLWKKIALFVEAKIGEKANAAQEELQVEFDKELDEAKEGLVETLDEYLNYFTEKFIEDNEDEIVDSVKVRTAERVLEGMDNFVKEFNIHLDEDVTVNDEESTELKEDNNRLINDNIELRKEIREYKKETLIAEKAEMFEIDSEKSNFISLAEGFEYENDDESFNNKLDLLSKSINNSRDNTNEDGDILENKEEEDAAKRSLKEAATPNNTMKQYLHLLNR